MKLGEFDTALEHIQKDVIEQADTNPPVVRRLITKGFLLAMDCWLDENRHDYQAAVQRTTPWVDQIRPGEQTEPDWVALKLQLAKANRAWADQLQARDPRDPQIKGSREAARQLARQVSRTPRCRSGRSADAVGQHSGRRGRRGCGAEAGRDRRLTRRRAPPSMP